jgi:simple sugar transport system permease protein
MNFYANQVATGLALTILGVGLSGFIGRGYVGEALSTIDFQIPLLSSIPFVGKVLFSHDFWFISQLG